MGQPTEIAPEQKKTGPRSVEDVCDILWSLERKYNLLDWEVRGIKLWQACRMQMYSIVSHKTGVLEIPAADKMLQEVPKPRKTSWKKLKTLFRQTLRSNPLTSEKNLDAIVFSSKRYMQKEDGGLEDIYTAPVVAELKKAGQKFLYAHQAEKPGLQMDETVFILSGLALLRTLLETLLLKFPRFSARFSPADLALIQQIEDGVNEQAGISIRLLSMFESALAKFRVKQLYYRTLLRAKRPKQIYLVTSYGRMPLVWAAKAQNIEVVEIQHGTMSPYHLGYSYPSYPDDHKTPVYFPDRMRLWGPYWRDITPIPLPPEKLEMTGFSHFRQCRDLYPKADRKTQQVLVVSQEALSSQLAAFVAETAVQNPELTFMYKLHPREGRLLKTSPALQRLQTLPNVLLLQDGDLYALMAESAYLMGVFSTAIYEGLAFGCKPVLINLPGIDYIRTLIARYRIPVMDAPGILSDYLSQADACSIPADDFF